MAGVANAQTQIWTGATDTDWNTASNWTGGTPAATDDAVINTGTGNQPTLGVTTPGLTSTSVSAGTLAISNSGNLVSTDVNISGSGAIENAGAITGAVSVSDTGTLTNDGGTLSGPLTLNDSGSFRATSSGTIGALNIGAGATATISAATGTTLTQTGAFKPSSPSGSLTFGSATDTGRVVVTANGGSYGSDFSVNVAGGTLAAAGSQFAGVLSNISKTSVAAGATLDIGSIDTTVQRLGGAGTVTNSSATDRVLTLKNTSTFAGAISDGATNNLSLVRIGAGTTTLTGASGYTGSTTVAQGTLALGTGSSLVSTSVTIDAGAVLSTNGEHLADGTTLSNNGQFTVTGAETIGEINGNGAVTLTDPGVLTIAGAATATISNTFNGTGGLTFTNVSGAHTLSGANTHTGATTLEAGGLTLSGGSAIADTGAVVVNGGALALSNSETIGALSGTGGAIQLGSNTLTVNATSGSSDYAGAISGTGGISKTGAGTLALSGTNTYSGGTTIDGGTISISADNNLGTGALTLDGGTLQTTSSFTSSRATTLAAGGGTFNTNAGTTLTQSGQVIGSGTLTKTGAGTLVLSATTNNYSGGTVISQGTLKAIDAAIYVLGDVTNNATLELNTSSSGSTAFHYDVISGTGSLVKSGAGNVNLFGNNTYSGGTTISAGTLALVGTAGSLSGNVINNGGLSIFRSNAYTFAGDISGTGTLLNNGSATTTLTGSNTYSGTTTITSGTLQIGNGGTTGTLGTGNTVNNSMLAFNRSDDSSYAGVISGTGAVTKQGAGTLTLSGTNTYSGGTTIDGGTISISADNNLGTGALTLDGGTLQTTSSFTSSRATTLAAGGGTFNTNAGITLIQLGQVSGSGTLTKTGAGRLILSATNNNYTGGTIISQGTLRANLFAISELGNVTNNATLEFNASSGYRTDYFDSISGAGNLVKIGGGDVSLHGNNTHSGGTTISAGILALAGTAGSLTGNVINNGIFVLNRSNAYTFAGDISGTGKLRNTGSATTTLTGNNTYSDTTTITSGTLQIGNGGTTGTLGTGNTVNDSMLSFNRSDDSSYAGDISGTGAVTKEGAGTLTLSGTNTYSGGTTIDGGTISIGADNNLGTGALTLDGGTLQTTSSFTSSRGTTLNAGGGTFNTDAGTTLTQSGQISGTGSLQKVGTGTLLLSGANTYSGGTTVSAGTLQGNSTSLQGDILNNATVSFDQAVNGTYAGAMTGSGSLIKSSAGTLLLSGANTYSGGTTVSAGTLQGNSTSLQGNILNNAVVSFDQSVNGTYAGAMTGSGSLVKSSAGTLLLSGANTYSGGTTVSAGTLQGNSTSLQGNILNNAMVNFDQVADGVYAGAMSGTGGFIKSGAGRLTLSGGNTYSGGTTINGGTLAVNGSLASDVLVNNGGRLQGTGSVGSVTLASGGVYAPGNSIGTQVVNGDLAFNAGSTYEVETDPTGAGSDLIQVNGVATLAGQVQHIGESGTYRPLSTYTILSATGGFAGTTFAGATSDYAFLTPLLTYDLNNVYLGLLRNDVAVADFGQTSNQIATASALDSLPTGGALQIAILGLTNNEVPGALNALSGELYASANGAVLQNSQEFSQRLLQRSGNQLDENKRTALPLWIEGEGATRRNDGDSNTAEAIQRGGSVGIGGELAMPNDWILGGAFRYGDHRLSVDERNSHADIESYSFGLYARWAQPLEGGTLRTTVGGIYGVHSIDADRDIYTPGLQQSLSSNYDAISRQVFSQVGYAMAMDSGLQLEPYAGLSWTQVANDSFTEKGGNAALHGDSQNEDMTASTLGLRSQLPLSNGQFQLDAGLGWQHNFSDVNPAADLNFVGSSTFTVEGAALARDTAMLDLGASYRITPAVTVRAGYSGQFGDNVSSNGGNLTLAWEL